MRAWPSDVRDISNGACDSDGNFWWVGMYSEPNHPAYWAKYASLLNKFMLDSRFPFRALRFATCRGNDNRLLHLAKGLRRLKSPPLVINRGLLECLRGRRDLRLSILCRLVRILAGMCGRRCLGIFLVILWIGGIAAQFAGGLRRWRE